MIKKIIPFNNLYKTCNLASIILIIISLLLLLIKGLNYGVDFKGGTLIEIRTNDKNISISDLRKSFNKIISVLVKRKFTAKFVEPLTSSYDSIKDGIRGPITLYASGLSILFWLLEAISIYFILDAFGVDIIEFITIISTYTTSIMLGILSFLPIGLGVVEGTLASFFTMHGIDVSLALTIVIIIRLFTRWYGVSFGFIALKLSGGLVNYQEPNDSKS